MSQSMETSAGVQERLTTTSTPATDAPGEGLADASLDSRPRDARGGFVGAFARTVRRTRSHSVVGKVAVSALTVVVVAAVVVAGGALLNRPSGTGQTATASMTGASVPSVATSATAPASGPAGRPGTPGPPGPPGPAGPTAQSGSTGTGARSGSTGGTDSAAQGATAAAERRPSPSPKPVTYNGVAGRGCTSAGATYAEYGWYTKGDAGWWTLANGSYTGDGCDGQFTDMPMSGDAHWDQPGQAIVWGFNVGSRRQSCTLSLYVPTSNSPRDVAATRAHFLIVHDTGDTVSYADPTGQVFVNQGANHRRWVTLGTWPARNGTIVVKLTSRGNPSGYSMTYPHLAGGAVRARCVAA